MAKVGPRQKLAQWGTEAVTLLRAGFARQAFRRLVRDKSGTSYVRNAGIVGGRRAVFERALSAVVKRMKGSTEIADMVAWNEEALTHGTNLVTGYPDGPTNLPMYGKLLRAQGCSKLCRHTWLNTTNGLYW